MLTLGKTKFLGDGHRMSTFNSILAKYRKYSFSERDKGTRFEKLMQAFLLTYPVYEGLFEEVWLWNEFPFKKDFGGKDTRNGTFIWLPKEWRSDLCTIGLLY